MVAGRQQGKSSAAVRWLLTQPGERILLTSSEQRREHLRQTAQRMVGGREQVERWKFLAERIVVIDQFVGSRGLAFRHAREVGIDDAEEVFRILLGAELGFVTMNATLIPSPWQQHNRPGYVDSEVVDERSGLEGSMYGIRPHMYQNAEALETKRRLENQKSITTDFKGEKWLEA